MNFLQLVFALVISFVVLVVFYDRTAQEENLQKEPIDPGTKTFIFEPLYLPMVAMAFFVLCMIMYGGAPPVAIAARIALLFFHISVYYAVLLLLLPLLRRFISARACATLWIVPAVLYFQVYLSPLDGQPLFAITLPRRWLPTLALIWFVGFCGVMLWQMISHFTYRNFLLKNSEYFMDEDILFVWHTESIRHGIKVEIPVLISEEVSTPLTIGCFDRTMRLILPKQSYTDEEFSLIFRHELRHILRADSRTKLFMGFCAGVCWFNPLAWIARRKAADDLELSCDEAVLFDADEDTRKQYANLLLKTAGSSRGYTTCLSAAAGSLRYRLRNIVKPTKRLYGGLLVGAVMFPLIMMLGSVALADSPSTGETLIFNGVPSEFAVRRIWAYHWSDEQPDPSYAYDYQEEALTEYLASLSMRKVYAGEYIESEDYDWRISYLRNGRREFNVDYESAMGQTRLWLCDGMLFADIPLDSNPDLVEFVLEDEVDWAYIESLMNFADGRP